MKRISEGTRFKNKGINKTDCCKMMPSVRHVDPDILKRTQSLLLSSPYQELEKKLCLCLQVERNNWQTKMKAVLKQLDKEHKKGKKIKDSILEIILNLYSNRQDDMFFGEELTTKQLLDHLQELIENLMNFNLKLTKDINFGLWRNMSQESECGIEKFERFELSKDTIYDKKTLTLPNINAKHQKQRNSGNVRHGHKRESQPAKIPDKSKDLFYVDATKKNRKLHVANHSRNSQK